jgi:hypothetical protein
LKLLQLIQILRINRKWAAGPQDVAQNLGTLTARGGAKCLKGGIRSHGSRLWVVEKQGFWATGAFTAR